jgi:hypothetical protein
MSTTPDQWRRAVLMARALNYPEGLTKYEYTKGFTKADSIRFWADSHALGFIRLGNNLRGTARYGLPSEDETNLA